MREFLIITTNSIDLKTQKIFLLEHLNVNPRLSVLVEIRKVFEFVDFLVVAKEFPFIYVLAYKNAQIFFKSQAFFLFIVLPHFYLQLTALVSLFFFAEQIQKTFWSFRMVISLNFRANNILCIKCTYFVVWYVWYVWYSFQSCSLFHF